jgi:S-adenosylmethionine:tRNA ribosyltransferase-isomerase
VQLSDIDYDLPEELIAQKPIEPRDSARLLVNLVPGEISHRVVSDLDTLVGPGDLIVVNDTKVLPARLILQRKTGGAAEVLLLEQRSSDARLWEALVRPGKKIKEGELL